jgi:MFS family permease
MFVLYGAFSLPQGWLAGRFGRKNMLAAFYFGTGAALAGAGTVGGPWSLAAWLALAGLFAAIYHPIGTAMLVEAAGDRPGRSIGVNGVFGNVGVASAPVVTGLLAAQFSWRAAFVVPGLLCFALGFLWLRTPPLDAPALAALAFARGPAVLLLAGLAAAVIFGQVTVNETMTARYIAPAVRARMYSVRFFIGFLGSALAAPMVGWLHDSTGSVAAPLLVLAVCALAMLGCALWFPERREELMPELWTAPAGAPIVSGVAAE